MTDFEKYITDLGYVRCIGSIPTNNYCYSTLRDIQYTYIKEDYTPIIFGLNQKGFPPTLIHPRPKIKMKIRSKPTHTKQGHTVYFYGGTRKVVFNKTLKNDIIEIDELSDIAMNRVLEEESPEKIYKALKDNEIIFKYEI